MPMPYKSRTESKELQILKLLYRRMDLPDQMKQYYFNLKKGFEGEVKFDLLTKELQCECFIFNDLMLSINNTAIQIDSLIIASETIYIFEVKNYEGDYYYESDRLYMKNKVEVNNPLIQLKRSESLLRQLLQSLGYHLPIVASVVFINPEFTLYHAPLHLPFIFPTQLNRYFRKLKNLQSKLSRKHKDLANQLFSLHCEESPYRQLPSYDFDRLRKGITCAKCDSFFTYIERMNVCCKECGNNELIATAVMRNVEEFKLLFPNRKITTNAIYEWCKIIESKKKIKRVLETNLKIVGANRWSYYQ